MIPSDQLIQALEQTFTDRRVDTEEKSELFSLFQSLNREQRAFVRNRAFDIVKSNQQHEPIAPLLKWLQAIIKNLDSSRPAIPESDTYFSPGNTCLNILLSLINDAKKSVDICVFTISDNNIRDAILAAYARGICIRVITDNDKTEDLGSDIYTLAKKGVNIRTDQTRHHMHHKFAIFDGRKLITGSFNWTRSASLYNHENLVLLEDKDTVVEFGEEFEKLWAQFLPYRD